MINWDNCGGGGGDPREEEHEGPLQQGQEGYQLKVSVQNNIYNTLI